MAVHLENVSDGLAGATGPITTTVRVAGWLAQRARLSREQARAVQDAKELLGLAPTNHAVLHHSVHVESTGVPHPDNQAAIDVIASGTLAAARGVNMLGDYGHIAGDVLASNLILVGSPTGDAFARGLFGYRPAPRTAGMPVDALEKVGDGIEFPWVWDLGPDVLVKDLTVRRGTNGIGITQRPNWSIVGKGGQIVPEVDAFGRIKTDFLLISRFPNPIGPRRAAVVSIAGCHGTGTHAIGLVLRDRPLLAALSRAIRSQQQPALPAGQTFYQALVEVEVAHDRSGHSYARKARLRDATVFSPSDAALAAHRTMVAEIGADQVLRSLIASAEA